MVRTTIGCNEISASPRDRSWLQSTAIIDTHKMRSRLAEWRMQRQRFECWCWSAWQSLPLQQLPTNNYLVSILNTVAHIMRAVGDACQRTSSTLCWRHLSQMTSVITAKWRTPAATPSQRSHHLPALNADSWRKNYGNWMYRTWLFVEIQRTVYFKLHCEGQINHSVLDRVNYTSLLGLTSKFLKNSKIILAPSDNFSSNRISENRLYPLDCRLDLNL